MPTLEALMKVHARAVHKDFYRDGKLMAPLWLIENKDNKTLLLMTPMDENDDRDAHAQMVRGAIREFGGVRYAYAAESWFVRLDPGEPPRVRPSAHVDRREALMIHGEDINGEQLGIMYEIKRHEGRKPFLMKALKMSDDFGGRFSNMFSVGPYT